MLHNPLDAEVELTNLTTVVREAGNDDMTSTREYVDVEVISRLVLGARETRTVRFARTGLWSKFHVTS